MPVAAIPSAPPRAAHAQGWRPDTIGLPRAAGLAAALVAASLGWAVYLAGYAVVSPPIPPVTVRLVDAASAIAEPAVAAPAPAPLSDAAAPSAPEAAMSAAMSPAPELASAPLPPVEPPLATPSPIALAAPPIAAPPADPALRLRSAPPRRIRPAARAPAIPSEPPVDIAAPATSPPLAARPPPDVRSGLGPYGAALHRQIERNMLADRRVTQLGVSGTAVVEATIAPDGRVVSARLAQGSGVRGIDEAALGAVQRGGFPPFGPHMPAGPVTMSVPIRVEAE